MSKKEKLVERLKTKPCDFTWQELSALLLGFGYSQVPGGKTGGSRVKFEHEVKKPIVLHKPHPSNIIKKYLIKDILDILKKENLL
jgi:hypothetical protein